MATKQIIPTFEEVKAQRPGLDAAGYGLGVFLEETKKDPRYTAFEAKTRRRMAQPTHKVVMMNRSADLLVFQAEELLHHTSPIVRAKAQKEVEECILRLTGLLKA